jgi:UDP-sugar diphosphatase
MRKLTTFLLILLVASCPIPSAQAGTLYSPAPQSGELFFTILHTNDEHSALSPTPLVDYASEESNPSLGGYARLAQAVKDIRAAKGAANEPVLLLSAGDYLGGSPYSWLALTGKAPDLTIMNRIGYDAVIIGNHEYDYGPELLAQYLQTAGYPEANEHTILLASNTLPPAGHALNDLGIQKTAVLNLPNGLKVGLFGLIGIDAVNVAPYAEPVEFADQAETARSMVAALKKEGVDIIVALSHSGEDEDADLVRAVPGIDVIVGGHTHVFLEEPIIEGETIIVQAGENLKYLGNLELAYNPSTGKLRIRNPETGKLYGIPLDASIPEEPEIAALVAEDTADLNALVAEMTEGRFTDIAETVVWSGFPVPNTPVLQETPFANFVTDAMRLVAEEATGERVHLAVQANGVLRGSINPGTCPWSEDKVSFYDLAYLVALGSGPDGKAGYPMVSVYLTGQELRRIFEVQVLLAELMGDTYFLQISGARMTYDPGRAVLLTVPFLDLPIPTTMAVLSGELYAGEGIQDTEEYVKIKKRDQELYHVVTDYYIAAFLPMAGELLPSLELVLKDKAGNPIENIDEAIIYRNGRELKVWQAVLEYAAAQPLNSQGHPQIPSYYADTAGRLVPISTFPPLWVWLLLALAVLAGAIYLAIRGLKKRRRSKTVQA